MTTRVDPAVPWSPGTLEYSALLGTETPQGLILATPPGGVTHAEAMALLRYADYGMGMQQQRKDRLSIQRLEWIEAAISITDDAIDHMMRKR